MLPTVCGVRDEAGECTFAGIEAESSANCIMPLNSVIDRLKALKVGDGVGGVGAGGEGGHLWTDWWRGKGEMGKGEIKSRGGEGGFLASTVLLPPSPLLTAGVQ